MSQHLSRRRMLAGGGIALVPLLGTTEALATAVCVVPPEAGAWVNGDITEMETITRLNLRFECGPGVKRHERWYVSGWYARNRRTRPEHEHPLGEVEVRYTSGVGSRPLNVEWPVLGVRPLIRLTAFVRMHHIRGSGRVVGAIDGSFAIQKVPGAAFSIHRDLSFFRPSSGL